MRLAKISSKAAGLVAAAITAAPRVANACAMCGLSPGDHASHAFNTSVIFMIVGPYLTVGLIAGVLYAAWRKAHRDNGIAGPKK